MKDLKEGYGIFEWPEGRKSIGNWFQGKQHGKGVYISPSGSRREGFWQQGKLIHWIVNDAKQDRMQ